MSVSEKLSQRWAALRSHAAFQSALVIGGAGWFALQVADVLGIPLLVVRVIGVTLLVIVAGLLTAALVSTGASARREAVSVGRRGRLLLAGAAALVLLGTMVWWVGPRLLHRRVSAGADVIAVLPFSTSGQEVEYLAEGLVDLLSTDLDGVGEIRVIDPRSALAEWRRRGHGETLGPDESRAAARALGAGSVLTGSVVAVGAETRLSASLTRVDGAGLADATASGTTDSILSLVDRLATELLRDVWKTREPLPTVRVSAITTSSPDALRSYLRGERYYRRSQWDSALAAFENAVIEDSTFALAHARLAMSHGWSEELGSPASRENLAAAARFAERLPRRDRSLIAAEQLLEDGQTAALDSLEQYVHTFPDDAAGWQFLADARFHSLLITGRPLRAILATFDQAIRVDSQAAPSYIHPLDLSMMLDDSVRFDAYLAGLERTASPGNTALYRMARDLRWGPPSRAAGLLAGFLRAPRLNLTETRIVYLAAALGTLHSRVPDPAAMVVVEDSLDSIIATLMPAVQASTVNRLTNRFGLLVGLGRFKAADAQIDSIAQIDRSAFRNLLPDAMSDAAPASMRNRVLEGLEGRDDRVVVYWRVIADLLDANVADARKRLRPALADTTESVSVPRPFLQALSAWADIVEGDTTGGLEQLRHSIFELGYSPEPQFAMQPLLLALARTQAMWPPTRDEGLSRLESLLALMGVFDVHLYDTMAEALENAGRLAEAAQSYDRFTRLWSDADPVAQPIVEAARQAVERITAETTQR